MQKGGARERQRQKEKKMKEKEKREKKEKRKKSITNRIVPRVYSIPFFFFHTPKKKKPCPLDCVLLESRCSVLYRAVAFSFHFVFVLFGLRRLILLLFFFSSLLLSCERKKNFEHQKIHKKTIFFCTKQKTEESGGVNKNTVRQPTCGENVTEKTCSTLLPDDDGLGSKSKAFHFLLSIFLFIFHLLLLLPPPPLPSLTIPSPPLQQSM